MVKKKKLRRYPWEKWMNRAWRSQAGRQTLKRGRDYDCMTHCMAIQIRSEARFWGCRAEIKIHDSGNSLTFKLKGKDDV